MVVLAVRRNKPAIALAVASIATYAILGWVVTGPGDTLVWLTGYAISWGLYLALFVVHTDQVDWVGSPWLLLGWALLARLVLVDSTPWLSDDLFRYLLDGKVSAAGINPYRFAPEHPTVQAIAPELAARVNHPDIPTIYPPAIQALGLVAAWFGWGITAWRVFVSVLDVAAMALVARLFFGHDRGWRAAAVYGLCPLAVWESGANGHLEPIVVLCFLAGVLQWRRGRWAWAGVAIAAASMAKFYPLLVLPAWLRDRFAIRVILMAAGSTALVTWAFASGGVDVFAGMRAYLEHWSFNGPIYELGSRLGLPPSLGRLLPFLVIGTAGVVAAIRRETPERVTPFLLFAFLVLGPTLHPWYALWVLPWLGDRPHAGLWSFVAAMGGAYAVWWQMVHHGRWELPPVAAVAIWALVALGWWAEMRRDTPHTPEAV